MSRRLSLRAERRGNAAIEFAVVAPVLVLLVAAIVELSLVTLTSGSLQAAVAKASRYGVTGQAADGERRAAILAILAERTFGLIDIGSAEIETLVYPSFAAIGTAEPFTDTNDNGAHDPGEPFVDSNGNGVWDADMGAAGLGGPGDIVLYQVRYQSRLMTSLLEPMLGEVSYAATVAVRNEPF